MNETEIRSVANALEADQLIASVKRAGFRRMRDALQIDHVFDTEDAKLFRNGSKIRIRIEGDTAELTHKSSLLGSDEVSIREETGFHLSPKDAPAAGLFMASIGYPHLFTLPKHRVEFVRERIHISIDKLPIIGRVIEIEGEQEKTLRAVGKRVAPSLTFANYRLLEMTQMAMEESEKSFAEMKTEAEVEWRMNFGNLALALGLDGTNV